MAGIKDLEKLLKSMSPELLSDEYVFCSILNSQYGDYQELSSLSTFREKEGLSLVVIKENADKSGLKYDTVYKCITLTVHSSLEAVGLTAAVSTKLSEHQISANIIAAYYHDHVFVPIGSAGKALDLLSEFSN